MSTVLEVNNVFLSNSFTQLYILLLAQHTHKLNQQIDARFVCYSDQRITIKTTMDKKSERNIVTTNRKSAIN